AAAVMSRPSRTKLRSSRLTRPVSMKSRFSSSWLSIEKSAQCEQVSEANSTILIGASGLPMTWPPSGVTATTSDQALPAGGATLAITACCSAGSVLLSPHAASASAPSEDRRARRRAGRVFTSFSVSSGRGSLFEICLLDLLERGVEDRFQFGPMAGRGALAVDEEGRRARDAVGVDADAGHPHQLGLGDAARKTAIDL